MLMLVTPLALTLTVIATPPSTLTIYPPLLTHSCQLHYSLSAILTLIPHISSIPSTTIYRFVPADTSIVSNTHIEFYLNSHAAIQGIQHNQTSLSYLHPIPDSGNI